MSLTAIAQRDDVELASVTPVTFTDLEETAQAAAAITRTCGAARILGLPDEQALAFGERLGELLAERVSPWAAPPAAVTASSGSGVRCQGVTPPDAITAPGVSPWSTQVSAP